MNFELTALWNSISPVKMERKKFAVLMRLWVCDFVSDFMTLCMITECTAFDNAKNTRLSSQTNLLKCYTFTLFAMIRNHTWYICMY